MATGIAEEIILNHYSIAPLTAAKKVILCETYNDKGELNSFLYEYGKSGQEPQILLSGERNAVYIPVVVASTTIDFLSRAVWIPTEIHVKPIIQ